MARPKKKTVDYFPHIIKDGKTITILENRFGNDGYAFWFKLLEILGSTEGHSYRYENTANKEFLYAKTNVSQEKAEKILDLLAELEAIDPELWEHNIIWSDNFIDNIADVYQKRSNGVPQKPVIEDKNPEQKEFSNQKPKSNDVSEEKTPQSKLKETKVKKKKRKKLPPTPHQKIADLYNQYCPDMPKCIKISDRRKEHLRARWKDVYEIVKTKYDDLPEDELKEKMLAIFEMLFKKAGQSDFMNGNNDRNWGASLDWMIKNNNNFTKVLEGKYDNERMKNNNSPPGQEKSLEEMYQEGWR